MTSKYQEAIRTVSETRKDRFKGMHTSGTKYLLETHMAVHYVNWTKPGQEREDLKPKKRFFTKNYKYQLELDKDLNIIGSNWLNSAKKVWAPDFLWYYPTDTKVNEYYTSATNGFEYKAGDTISNDFTQGILKSLTNTIGLSYVNRLYLPKSQEADLLVQAQKYAKTNGIKLFETQSVFESQLDAIGVRKSNENPQIVSKIIYEILKKK